MDNTPSPPSSAWLKSSSCQTSACAEVSRQGESIAIRSSRAPDAVVYYTAEEWAAFAAGLRAGDFDHLLK